MNDRPHTEKTPGAVKHDPGCTPSISSTSFVDTDHASTAYGRIHLPNAFAIGLACRSEVPSIVHQ